jgi:hypothetical protein
MVDRFNVQRSAFSTDTPEVPFGSNEVRLSPGEWVIALVLIVGLFHLIPVLWERIEPLEPGPDYRVPYRLGNDYWMIRRYFRRAGSDDKILVIGDSVVWGHFVGKDQTLSHYLNEITGQQQFANLGIDGIEPAAMAGLIDFYGADIASRKVVLHCNLLWTADKRRDLQTTKERPLTHPALIPQFFPWIPCYKESLSGRLGIVVAREVSFLGWVKHLQIAYFDNTDLPLWTTEHPYESPTSAVSLELPSPDEPPSPDLAAKPWTESRNFKGKDDFPWVELESSFQWSSFKRALKILEDRGNRVFVLVGPYNEHKLTDQSRKIYRRRLGEADAWLRENGVPHAAPAVLPSEYYADASHPLAEGYKLLAQRLLEDETFVRFLATPVR